MSRGYAHESEDTDRPSGLSLRATRRGELLSDTYRLLDLIGAGGMAEVYSAEHLRLGRKFAVKVLRAGPSRQSVERFRQEARAIARVDNEFVVGVIDCGEAGDGTPYLVLELLHGEDLRSLLQREGTLPIPRAVHFVWEACQGVAAVHALSLIHRDLKPENLYVSKRASGEDWCRVLDFGIAKADVSCATAEGAVLGTVAYMAPEQLQDAASVGPSVDIHALGVVLYECLTGAPPYSARTIQELMFKILNEQAPRLERNRPGLPKGLADAVERALAKSPAERFADVRQFAAAIAPYARLAGVEQLDPQFATVDLERGDDQPRLERRTARWSYAAIVLSGVIGLGVGSTQRRPAVLPRAAIVPPKLQTKPASSAQYAASAAIVSPSTSVVAATPSPPAASVATSAASSKARAVGAVRRQSALPQRHFDSENPYGR